MKSHSHSHLLKFTILTIVMLKASITINARNPAKDNYDSNSTPIIAVHALPYPWDSEKYETDRVNINYVRWLESAGARVVVIHTWYDTTKIEDIVSKSNGVLFQGGDRNLNTTHKWEKDAQDILGTVLEMNLIEKKYTPLWATCLGFELLHLIISNSTDIISSFDGHNMMSSILQTSEFKNSKMFESFSPELIEYINNNTVVNENHMKGVAAEVYTEGLDNKINQFFKMTSTGKDKMGKSFVNSVEAREYPVYGVQFHTEKSPYNKNPDDAIPRNIEALDVSQKLALFFVNEARMNDNKMSEEDMMKYNFINTFEKDGKTFEDGYYVYKKSDEKIDSKSDSLLFLH